MRVFHPLASAMALLAMAAPALADTTPQALWAMIQTRIADAGGTLSATPRSRSDGMVLAGGRITLRSGAVVMLPDVTLRDMGDGSVTLDLPPRFPLVIDLPARPGDPDRVALTVTTTDLFASFRDIGPDAVDATLAATAITVTPDPRDETARALARSGIAGAADAQLALSGALTFATTNPMPVIGVPTPEGTVTIELTGITTLLTALEAIDAVSSDDLFAVRMGLAVMAKPGAGSDHLVSEIEVRPGGSLFVNGVKLQ